MLLSRPLLRLTLFGLMLLPLAGCSTSSMKNLFSWNRRSEYHTLEELEKQSGKQQKPPAKMASWNPLKRTAATPARTDSESSAQPAEQPQVASASPFHGGADQAAAQDPFLRDEALSNASKPRSIQRTSAVISSAEETAVSQATEETEQSDVAEVLIIPGKTTEKPVTSSFEAQKLAELDALLEGRELAGARRAGKAASVKAGQAEEALKRAKAAAATRARKASELAEQTAETTRKRIEESVAAEFDAGLDDRAEPLIRHRSELVEDTEITAVAAAEALFGSDDTVPQPRASAHAEESRKFGWKSGATHRPNPIADSVASPFRLAGMQHEAEADPVADAGQQIVADSQPTPDFDAQSVSDAVQHAPTSGTPFRDGSRNAVATVAAPAPALSPGPIADLSEAGEATETAESPATSAAAEVGRARLLLGLSGRTWCLAAAGGVVIAFLFLPSRRRVLLRQTVAGHA